MTIYERHMKSGYSYWVNEVKDLMLISLYAALLRATFTLDHRASHHGISLISMLHTEINDQELLGKFHAFLPLLTHLLLANHWCVSIAAQHYGRAQEPLKTTAIIGAAVLRMLQQFPPVAVLARSSKS